METRTLEIPVVWPNYFEDCDQCVERLKQTLECLEGMQSVRVHADRRSVEVSYSKDLLTFEAIRQAARDLGVTLAEKFKHEKLLLTGLDCPDCATKLEAAISRMPGVEWTSVNFATSVLIAEYQPELTSVSAIIKRIREFGYDAEPADAKGTEIYTSTKAKLSRNIRTILTATSGIFLASGLITQLLHRHDLSAILLILSVLSGGLFVARSAYYSLRGGILDTNSLMSLATAGAIWLGDYGEAAAVVFLFSVGSTLEAFTVEKARRSIKSLIESFPSHVFVKRGDKIQSVALTNVEVGETVLIKPGDRIPVDGTVVSGESTVNEAPITGEPIPKFKTAGDPVYAGSINGEGAIEVRTSSRVEDNTVSRIVHMVEEAQSQKAASQRFSERVGRYYTPVVILTAVLVVLFGSLLYRGTYATWVRLALTLLVVACPCALVVSVPVTVVCAIANAARSGILIKGGAHLEALGEITVMAFDKTGTLTTGRPTVCDATALNGHKIEDVLAIAAAVESRSEHPLATAVVEYARSRGVREVPVSFFEAIPGKGARAVADGELYYVGSRRLMSELGFDTPNSELPGNCNPPPYTVIYVANEREAIGMIGLRDAVRPTARTTTAQLRTVGIRKIVLLTGDSADAARSLANELGIDEFHAELLPQDKVRLIRELQSGCDKVAMVGDGINDAPALAAAHVGIAMGGLGSHASIEASDITLMADDILMLPYALRLGAKARRIIRQNLVFSIAVGIFLIVGALSRNVTLATGVLAHEASALLVIANGMRLLKKLRNETT